MQIMHVDHAYIALHKIENPDYIGIIESEFFRSGFGKPLPGNPDETARSIERKIFGDCALLLPARSDLTDGTPPPSCQSYSTTPTGSPPPVGVLSLGVKACNLVKVIQQVHDFTHGSRDCRCAHDLGTCPKFPTVLPRFCPEFEIFMNIFQ
jgi:hypothetical protein